MGNTLTINELACLECPREEDKDHSSLRGEESRTSRDGQQGYANLMVSKDTRGRTHPYQNTTLGR